MKPILFNTEMVKAILDGRKTVTRRIVKNAPNNVYAGSCVLGAGLFDEATHMRVVEAPIKIGDILYVRETWTRLCYVDPDGYTHFDQEMYYYAADGTPDITLVDDDGFMLDDQRIKWKPSIHMPKEIARIFLRVKNVRVERLQDITADECPSEGVWPLANCQVGDRERYYKAAFAELWDSTIKPADLPEYGWDANPWVFVIEFKRISKEEATK